MTDFIDSVVGGISDIFSGGGDAVSSGGSDLSTGGWIDQALNDPNFDWSQYYSSGSDYTSGDNNLGLLDSLGSALGGSGSSSSGSSGSSSGGGFGLGSLTGLGLAGAQVVGGLLGANAAQSAAKIQSTAATNAANTQAGIYNTVRADLMPYQAVGLAGTNSLTQLMGLGAGGNPMTSELLSKFNPTTAQLEATPGYQFTKDQGLKAVQNSAAAQGLGISGASMRGAADYAAGLASQTYQQQYNNYWNQNNNIMNALSSAMSTGQNAAVQSGTSGYNNTLAANNYLTGGAAANAAGQVGTANAANSAINNISNLAMTNSLLQGMYGR